MVAAAENSAHLLLQILQDALHDANLLPGPINWSRKPNNCNGIWMLFDKSNTKCMTMFIIIKVCKAKSYYICLSKPFIKIYIIIKLSCQELLLGTRKVCYQVSSSNIRFMLDRVSPASVITFSMLMFSCLVSDPHVPLATCHLWHWPHCFLKTF